MPSAMRKHIEQSMRRSVAAVSRVPVAQSPACCAPIEMSSLEAVKMHLKGGALGRTFGNEQARARAFEGVRAGTEGGDKNSRCGRDNADEHSAMQEKVQAIQGIRG